MSKKLPYDTIPLVPAIIAESVCSQPYTGAEWSKGALSHADISKVEIARQRMAQAQIREFADLCERKCRAAYEADAKWMMKCARAKSNRGRDQLVSQLPQREGVYVLTSGSNLHNNQLDYAGGPSVVLMNSLSNFTGISTILRGTDGLEVFVCGFGPLCRRPGAIGRGGVVKQVDPLLAVPVGDQRLHGVDRRCVGPPQEAA